MADRSIILIVGGGHCRSSIDVIEQDGSIRIAGIIERAGAPQKRVLGYPVIGSDDDLPALRKQHGHAIITIGQIRTAEPRVRLFARLKEHGFNLPVIVSSWAYVSKHAEIGEGTIIMHGAVVNAGAVIGTNCIINTKALIEHDARIGDHTHISTAAVINGSAIIGECSFIGSNATIVHEVKLPAGSFVRAGQLIAHTATAQT